MVGGDMTNDAEADDGVIDEPPIAPKPSTDDFDPDIPPREVEQHSEAEIDVMAEGALEDALNVYEEAERYLVRRAVDYHDHWRYQALRVREDYISAFGGMAIINNLLAGPATLPGNTDFEDLQFFGDLPTSVATVLAIGNGAVSAGTLFYAVKAFRQVENLKIAQSGRASMQAISQFQYVDDVAAGVRGGSKAAKLTEDAVKAGGDDLVKGGYALTKGGKSTKALKALRTSGRWAKFSGGMAVLGAVGSGVGIYYAVENQKRRLAWLRDSLKALQNWYVITTREGVNAKEAHDAMFSDLDEARQTLGYATIEELVAGVGQDIRSAATYRAANDTATRLICRDVEGATFDDEAVASIVALRIEGVANLRQRIKDNPSICPVD